MVFSRIGPTRRNWPGLFPPIVSQFHRFWARVCICNPLNNKHIYDFLFYFFAIMWEFICNNYIYIEREAEQRREKRNAFGSRNNGWCEGQRAQLRTDNGHGHGNLGAKDFPTSVLRHKFMKQRWNQQSYCSVVVFTYSDFTLVN